MEFSGGNSSEMFLGFTECGLIRLLGCPPKSLRGLPVSWTISLDMFSSMKLDDDWFLDNGVVHRNANSAIVMGASSVDVGVLALGEAEAVLTSPAKLESGSLSLLDGRPGRLL